MIEEETMKNDLWVEIRDTGHIKLYEASKSTEMTEEEIENAVFNRGYIAINIEITFDELQKLWRAYGDIREIKDFKTDNYLIT